MRALWLLLLLPSITQAQVCEADATCGRVALCTARPELPLTCHRRCQEGCAEPERCTVLRPPDDERWPRERRRYVCTDEPKTLCAPCERDADCDGFLDRCVMQLSGERTCGRDCSWDDECPKGYQCADPGGVDGRALRRQCVPQAGCCACDRGFFIPAERPPEPATATSGASGSSGLPLPSSQRPSPAVVPVLPAGSSRQPGWRSPSAGAPSTVPVGTPSHAGTPSSSSRFGAPGPAPSVGVTPRAAPASPHTNAGPLPAPRPSSVGTSTPSRPTPSQTGRATAK